jgi:menaquinone-9 beta-reductase
MARQQPFDIVVAGGGIAGSCFAGVMARAGYGVLLVEREAQFRDRVRSECTWPWGVAELTRLGLREVLDRAGAVAVLSVTMYRDRQPSEIYPWAEFSIDQLPALGYLHPVLQETAFVWAAEQGVTTLRPAKAVDYRPGNPPAVSIQHGDASFEVATRLIVGAGGKHSGARRWTGGESAADPDHHRIGGVLMTGISRAEFTGEYVPTPEQLVLWFPSSPEHTRLYIATRSTDSSASPLPRPLRERSMVRCKPDPSLSFQTPTPGQPASPERRSR